MKFEYITNKDQHRWQLRAAEVVAKLLDYGFDQDLPPLQWTIASTGALVGDVDSLSTSNADRRAAFDAWTDYLGGERWQEHPRMHGGIHLHALFAHPTNRGDVKGAIRADLDPDNTEQQ